jgi:hypothetical protein
MLQPTQNPLLTRPPGDLPTTRILRRRCTKRDFKLRLAESSFADLLDHLPADGEYLHAACRGNSPSWAIVGAVLQLARPAKIDHLAIATLSYNATNARSLFDMLDAGDIRTVDFLASCYFEKANPREYKMLADGLAERNQRLGIARNHAKVIAIRLTDDRCVVAEGSANLRSCRNVEQLIVTGGEDIFTFHQTWIRDMIRSATP